MIVTIYRQGWALPLASAAPSVVEVLATSPPRISCVPSPSVVEVLAEGWALCLNTLRCRIALQ
jgi:hypothetical protein